MKKNSKKLDLIHEANKALTGSMRSCRLCPRKCRADRAAGKFGYCRAPDNPVVYSYLPHHGEEPPISGQRGSGTIFFSHCNMKCVYCQNYYFSQLDKGKEITTDRLADIMLALQNKGCHNINLVTPTHFILQILSALEIATRGGLTIPIVYNTSGYEEDDTIKLLDGIIDIYMPDMRYSDNSMAIKYSDASGYAEANRAAVKEMHRQVGYLETDDTGVAKKGVIIRLLALPNNISGATDTLRFIRNELGADTYMSIMSQYYPTFKACAYADISRNVTSDEYANIIDESHRIGLNNGWAQEDPGETDTKFLGTNIEPKERAD